MASIVLPDPGGRADHQDVVSSGRSHLNGALRVRLPLHITEIAPVVFHVLDHLAREDPGGSEGAGFIDQVKRFHQSSNTIDLQFLDHRRLAGVLQRNNQPAETLLPCCGGDGEDAAHGTNRAVERKLAQQELAVERSFEHDPCGSQDTDGDRQVEPGTFLSHVGGGQVDGDILEGKFQAAVLDGGADALAAFSDGRVGKPHGGQLPGAGGDVNLYLHNVGVNPEYGGA